MSLCINPDCKQSNPDDQLFCKSCGSEILLLGRYQVIRLLSEKGGFADTYEVLHHGVGQVLKVLKDSNPKAIELFQREFEVLNQSDHPGIPKAEEYFEFTPRNHATALHCLVMEKILGTDLEEYLKQRGTPIDERCAINWLDQIAQILQVIHNQKLLHRDIKPSNIILQPDGQLVLIDFGAVGRFNHPESTQHPGGPTFIFTPGYAAPEQTMGRAVPESDIFSLGCTFVYLLTGKQIATMRDANGEWNWTTHVNHLSPQLVALVEQMMSQQIEARPRTATKLLEWVAAHRPISISRASNQVQPFPVTPSHPLAETIIPNSEGKIPSMPAYSTTQTTSLPPTTTTPLASAGLSQGSANTSRKGFIILGAIAGVALLSSFAYAVILLTNPNSKPLTTAEGSTSNVATTNGKKCSSPDLVKKSGNNYGAIEVGSKGVKAEVVQALDQANDAGFKYIARSEDIDSQNTNPIDPKSQSATVQAITSVMQEMQERFKIPCEQILIYGSSGLAQKAPHKDALIAAIQEASGRKMEIISAADESKYVFDGVVPEWRRPEVVTVDIGSGNTKGAFLSGNTYETYEVAVGTGDATIQIDKQLDNKSFTAKAEEQTKNTVLPVIRESLRKYPKLSNTRRIYLAGGIVWAMATLTRPCEQEQKVERLKEERVAGFTRLRAEDINTFYNNATRDRKTLFQPNLSSCTPEQLKKAEKEIKSVEAKFPEKDLIAGAGILRAFSQEMNFAEKDSIFFARYAIEALPIGYLIQKLEGQAKP